MDPESMDLESDQKRLDRLARVRENQRKSRARKQEYIRELEQKLAACKDEVRQKDVEHRLVVQRLEAENRKLRHLLSGLGAQPGTIDEYLRVVDNPAATQKVAIPALPRPEVSSATRCQEIKRCGPSTYRPSPCGKRAPEPAPSDGNETVKRVKAEESGTIHRLEPSVSGGSPENNDPGSAQQDSNRESRQTSISPEDEFVCGCSPVDEESAESWPANQDVLNTTLCAMAGDLIRQYNTRGVDMEEIRARLRDGFRKGLAAGEGCRVQNQVLFQVLDEISNSF